MLDLSWLLAPFDSTEFLASYWESRPLHVRRDASGFYDPLLTRADLDRILSLAEMTTPVVELVEKGQRRENERDHGVSFGPRDLDELYAGYGRGATLKWRYLDTRCRPVAELCQALEGTLSGDLGAEMYLTPPGSQGFAAHFDKYHFFVLQIDGSKHWRIYDRPFPFPRKGHGTARPDDPRNVIAEIELRPGELLYLPRGYFHDAWTGDAASLSVNVGVQVYTWFDALVAALEAVEQSDSSFRRALPAGFTREGAAALPGMREEFARLLASFVEHARIDAAVDRLAERFTWHSHQPLDGFLADFSASADLAPTTVLKRRSNLAHRIVIDGDSVTLVLPQRRIRAPAHVEEALRFIVAADELSADALPGPLSDDAKLVLLRRLVREGFLTVVTPVAADAPHVPRAVSRPGG
ncbi:MAG: hypothetical protein IT379_18305 [Deltaproteobacteria bacterium]|nr:hypothetical protein [Deltaproteobacteria bacterium]